MIAEVRIIALGREGQGVGYDSEENIYFIPGGIPGDRVLAETDQIKRYRDAHLVELIAPSPDRRDSPCEYFKACGGCDWLNLTYSAQIKAKESSLDHILARSGIKAEQRLPVLAASRELGYRARVQLRRQGHLVGFFKRQTNEIVDVKECLVATPAVNRELQKIRQEGTDLDRAQKIELEVDENGVVHRSYDEPHGAQGFSQVNPEQNKVLRQLVSERVGLSKAERLLELFCGDGNLTFALTPHVGKKIVGIDNNARAIAKAEARAGEVSESLEMRFICDSVDYSALRRLTHEFDGGYDTLVLDPPRPGVGKKLEAFVTPSVQNIIYVSCSPLTFSQDIRPLLKSFQLLWMQPVDMFPQTKHLELVAHLRRID